MTEGINDGQQNASETETQVSPEAQRAQSLLARILVARQVQQARSAELVSAVDTFEERNDARSKSVLHGLRTAQGWVNTQGHEMNITEAVIEYILTGEEDSEFAPERANNLLTIEHIMTILGHDDT